MLRTFKYRLYPNISQQTSIQKTVDACRFVYNWSLATKQKAFETDGTSLSAYDLHKKFKELKQQHPWLKDVYSQSLQQATRRLHKAFQHFFRRMQQGEKEPGYPKFRSKKYHRQSFDIPQGTKVDIERRRVYLPKIGHVKTIFHRKFEGTAKTCTVISTNTGKYFICIAVEDGKTPSRKRKITSKNSIGIDVGLKTYATTSAGEKISNPQFLQSSLKQLQYLHRKLSRKKKGSKNYEKVRTRLGKCYERIANQRADFQHKLTTRLIRENQAIIVESLNVSSMRQNRRLSRAISDAAWSKFLGMLSYKVEQSDVTLIQVGVFEPTTKLCHRCGFKNNRLTLSDREWTCPKCSTHHDRDINAAKNIKMIGLKIKTTSGEPGTGPVELPVVTGAVKQEVRH